MHIGLHKFESILSPTVRIMNLILDGLVEEYNIICIYNVLYNTIHNIQYSTISTLIIVRIIAFIAVCKYKNHELNLGLFYHISVKIHF